MFLPRVNMLNNIGSIEYEDRIVAFLDVLGWESSIDGSTSNSYLVQEMGNCLKFAFNKMTFTNAAVTKSQMQISLFSDCIAISINTKFGLPWIFVNAIYSIIDSFMVSGYAVRGGMAKGNLVHRDSIIYGPALNIAYRIEKEIAIYPRVVVDKELAQQFMERQFFYEDPKNPEKANGYLDLWRKDQDGCTFFHYLQPPILIPNIQIKQDLFDRPLKLAHKLIAPALNKYSNNLKLLQKYMWMASYYNMVIDELPADFEFEKIKI